MEHSPVPPNEREWRHPSEVAAEEAALVRAEALPASSRILAVTTGSAGLLAIAVLFLLVTPNRQALPVAVSASTSPAAADEPTGGATIVAARRTSQEVPPRTLSAPRALATPIGSGQFALVLRDSVDAADSDVELRLPSGTLTSGNVVEMDDGVGDAVLVELHEHEPGHDVAEHRPHDRDVVTLMAEPPIKVALADLHRVDVADGTPVIDSEGHLVGLCSRRVGGGVRLVEVPTDVSDAVDP